MFQKNQRLSPPGWSGMLKGRSLQGDASRSKSVSSEMMEDREKICYFEANGTIFFCHLTTAASSWVHTILHALSLNDTQSAKKDLLPVISGSTICFISFLSMQEE